MCLHGAGEPVLERQAALPIFWRHRPVHIFEQRLGVMPGERQGHEMRQRASFAFGNAFRAGNGSPAGRERVAGNDEIVGDGSALDVRFGAPRAIGKHFAFHVTVFRGIGINKHGRDAILFGSQGFESTIAVRIGIAHQNDFAFYINAILAQ